MSEEYEVKTPKHACQYIPMIGCQPDGRKCDKCGWNPEVTARRKEAIHKGESSR